MPRVLLLLFFSIQLTAAHAQFPDLLAAMFRQEHSYYSQVLDHFNTCKKNPQFKQAFPFYKKYPSFTDLQMIFEITYLDSVSKHERALYANAFLKGDKIVYLSLAENYPYKEPDKFLFRYIDTAFSLAVLKKHAQEDAIPPMINNLYEHHPEIYGVTWGLPFLGIEPGLHGYIKNVFDAIIAGDSLKIVADCNSFSPEQMAYGATGLYIWQKTNHPLNKQGLKLLASLQKNQLKLTYAPGGCSIETATMSQVLANDYLEVIYRDFLAYRKGLTARAE